MRHAVVGLLVLGTIVAVERPAGADLDPARVKAAIDRGIAFLRREQDKVTGAWPDYINNPTGVTALCTLALLSCGEDPHDPTVARAIEHLRRNPPSLLSEMRAANLTYAVSLQTMVYCAADPKADLPRIKKCVEWLEDSQVKEGQNEGGWWYRAASSIADNSNSQFALLALHEAERAGVKVKDETWRRALGYWKRGQDSSGSWSYVNPLPNGRQQGTGSMTCAGITSLIIASGRLGEPDAEIVGDTVRCCVPRQDVRNDPLQKGLDWLGRAFAVTHNPVGGKQRLDRREAERRYQLYYLYGVERVGRLTGQRWIGANDWYRLGTELLTGDGPQDPAEGSWRGASHGEENKHVATALALLFLSKGRRPVLIGKLQHGAGHDWNRHRRDLDNLTRYVEPRWKKETKTELTWQIISGQHAKLEDLRQTPVLFISGHDQLALSQEQKRTLRAYVDQGGFILAENCCEGGRFDADFRAFVAEMFPDGSLAPVDDPTHPIWSAEELLDPKWIAKHPILGVSTGCRLGVVYSPKSLGCYWELGRPARNSRFTYCDSQVVNQEIEFCLGLGINLLAYATNRQLKFKHDIPVAQDKQLPSDVQRGTIFVAKLKHEGGCDEAPAALENMLKTAGRELQLQINTERRLISITDPRLFDYHLVYIHGRRNFRLSEAERRALKTYLERGGMVLGDAINSNKEFGDAFRREIKAIFPDKSLERIPTNDPLITPDAANSYGIYDIRTVTLREPIVVAQGERRAVKHSSVPPLLEALKLDERYAVIFSPYDLSCALENYESLQFPGYSRDDAQKIVLNMLLYSLQR